MQIAFHEWRLYRRAMITSGVVSDAPPPEPPGTPPGTAPA
jgi:hypothetical protein